MQSARLFWCFGSFLFSRIRTGYKDLLCKSPYSVQIRRNLDQKKSGFGHFTCSESTQIMTKIALAKICLNEVTFTLGFNYFQWNTNYWKIEWWGILYSGCHCVKSDRIRSYSVPYYPAFGPNLEKWGPE